MRRGRPQNDLVTTMGNHLRRWTRPRTPHMSRCQERDLSSSVGTSAGTQYLKTDRKQMGGDSAGGRFVGRVHLRRLCGRSAHLLVSGLLGHALGSEWIELNWQGPQP
ncbi:hypothetical protein GW17_00015368 [Ensete ventricosum]|nr:hypothetical protein GW17_00015368 [Ensete ventricosum]